ncbi:hypothetical protein [Flavobacterium crassostreae]|uniref:Uncharacterized protein n=1 Tax=Flavobacterium crassostreae TaxID=1763534 RepID=A0A1B9E926_9FLAO|nr:hypothetical protein [Flavobacterium crassostreae]OCB78445.1 hypothetical protein LPBF_02225 [Flavobacterium crassostreae]
MTPKEKAKELVLKYTRYANGYVGSSMLTNTEYPEQIDKNAKEMALISINEIIYELSGLPRIPYNERRTKFWEDVRKEIESV